MSKQGPDLLRETFLVTTAPARRIRPKGAALCCPVNFTWADDAGRAAVGNTAGLEKTQELFQAPFHPFLFSLGVPLQDNGMIITPSKELFISLTRVCGRY